MSDAPTPLKGVKVLDLSRVLAGPWCGQTLADLGADVIKVERPGKGDDTRHWGPPWLGDSFESAYYLCANRGKRSVTVDMAAPEGQALIKTLSRGADVVVENFKVGGLKRYGLDFESLKALNPGLIYCSITGFGQQSPYAHRAGYDFMIQAMGGLMSLTGQPDEVPGGGPVKVGVAITDLFTGLYATNAILAALYARRDSGQGCHIDLSLMDVQVGVLANQATNYLTSGRVPERLGNAHPNIVPYQAFATLDGHIIVAVGNDEQFKRFCQVIEQPGLCDDPRFATNGARVANREELVPLLEATLALRSIDEWLAALEAVGVPCGPINTLDRVFEDAHVKARGLRKTFAHPQAGSVDLVANPVRIDGRSATAPTAPPLLGQHTDDVLEEIGITRQQREALKRAGII
ncbi:MULTISPECIES: CaiB/BaiF CoA transferase family protein [unclassified Halomonas]|uniref:CaiB/BaiF CoA transferase family protein n=1 Tax=unclassified Halomonas TaxID=2609666 RepID=UPI0021E4359C|nr:MULTISPECIES: CaiB/BaiF CoA-transferase family protein [unclassified Halomonas]UYF99176.1 CoA transferase [Halomonas sp. GD1P12]WNL39667.1 CaiB/BaiF CoA-transferase family protein [Halomonas sp. PAMB 3232]WNL43027.1 CaiB/BaiF CoA-transferase family protein [Halomonas sp. PAMB 3264]